MLLSCSTFELSSWFKGTISMDAFLELQCMSLLLGMKESSNWAVMSPQIKQTNSGLKPNHFHPVRNSRSSGVAFLLYFRAEQLVQRHYFDGCISRASLHEPPFRQARGLKLDCLPTSNKQSFDSDTICYFHIKQETPEAQVLVSCSTFQLSSWFKGTVLMDAFQELHSTSLLSVMQKNPLKLGCIPRSNKQVLTFSMLNKQETL